MDYFRFSSLFENSIGKHSIWKITYSVSKWGICCHFLKGFKIPLDHANLSVT